MKISIKKLIPLLSLSLISVGGVSLSILGRKTVEVHASKESQHEAAYAEYHYSGLYYSSKSISQNDIGESLRAKLTTAINPPSVPEYSGGLATHLPQSDEDPENSSNMIYLYTRDSNVKNNASNWNREHVWPKSLSNGNWGTGRAGADLLHLRPTYNSVNSTRSSIPFGNVTGGTERIYNGMTYAHTGGGYFMPLEADRGDIARIIMYVWVAYYDEYASKRPQILSVFQSYDTLLEWHINDIPDALEGHRNDYAEASMQKNRNPFVDHPDLAWKVFGSNCSSSTLAKAQAKYPSDWSDPDPSKIALDKTELTVNLGQTVKLTATREATWTSSNTKVAEMTVGTPASYVNIYGLKKGKTTITATDVDGNKATCLIKVSDGRGGIDDSDLVWIIPVAIAGGVILVAGIVVVTIIIVKKKKKK